MKRPARIAPGAGARQGCCSADRRGGMRRRDGSACWLAVLTGCLALVGCERAAVRPNYPRDPLLLSKRPVEGKVENTTTLVAQGEPVMPAVPPTALVSAPKGTALPTNRVPQLDE